MTAHLLHRNVCPGSVLVTRRGTWKLAGLEFAGTVVLGLVFLFLFSDSRFAIFFHLADFILHITFKIYSPPVCADTILTHCQGLFSYSNVVKEKQLEFLPHSRNCPYSIVYSISVGKLKKSRGKFKKE